MERPKASDQPVAAQAKAMELLNFLRKWLANRCRHRAGMRCGREGSCRGEGAAVVVYEGNAPQRQEGSIVIPWAQGWPAYLEISGPCASPSDCAAKSFAAEITRR
jgi:hypothetical protein